ncbi:MAG: type II toxin-antitoxin system RelE/ParE family toxin [Desulfobulbaceae bacterium]|nr:type II toxin-antitoxin system RelE/ParE family toxin [Desulfobulbaceae bacterium]
MITIFDHKGLKKFFESGSKRGIKPEHEARLKMILARLDASKSEEDMKLPGFKLHSLDKKGKLDFRGHWSVSVSGNWRITFKFENGNAVNVNYLDYH